MHHDENHLEPQLSSPETTDSPETAENPRGPRTGIENFYEHFRSVPLKYLDIFIGVCVAALILFIILGYLKGHGYF